MSDAQQFMDAAGFSDGHQWVSDTSGLHLREVLAEIDGQHMDGQWPDVGATPYVMRADESDVCYVLSRPCIDSDAWRFADGSVVLIHSDVWDTGRLYIPQELDDIRLAIEEDAELLAERNERTA